MRIFSLITGILILSSGFLLKAQPTLESVENYEIGEERRYAIGYSDTVKTIPKGDSITWNFKDIGKQDSVFQEIIHPDSAEEGDEFPNADFAERYGSENVVFHQKDPKGNNLRGIRSIQDILIEFITPFRVISLPFTYNDEYLDTGRREYNASGFTFKGTGWIRTKANGWGTLKLPDTTYKNTLLVYNVQEWNDTSESQFGPNINSDMITYTWYVGDKKYPLLRIDSIKINSNLFSDTTASLRYFYPKDTKDTGSGYPLNKPFAENTKVFKRANELIIQGDFSQRHNVRLNLLSLKGEQLRTRLMVFNTGWNKKYLSLHGLKPGMYILNGVNTQNGKPLFRRKIIVQ